MSKALKKIIDINRLREFKNKLVGAGSAYVQTSAVDQTIAGTKTFSKPIVGSVTGNAATATKATQDSDGNQINTTYSKVGHTHDYNDLINKPTSDLLPIGSYIQFAGSQAPDGFLVCNGGEISRTTYSALFAVIGTTYGSGDGSTTFNLPNLTDRFLQGSTTSGTVKNAGLPNITGELGAAPRYATGKRLDSVYARAGAFSYGGSESWISDLTTESAHEYSWHHIKLDASRSSSIYGNSTTVQPPALTCLICIKY